MVQNLAREAAKVMTLNPDSNAGGGNLPGVEHHRKTSRRLIRQARYELEKRGDRVQACDKASGAVAHGVKAVAESRCWRSDSHNHRRRIVHLLSIEYDLPDLLELPAAADQLRRNICEDLMYEEEVGSYLERITGLLATFTELLEREPNPDFVPDPQQERMLSRLRLSEEEIAERWTIDYPPPPPEDEELPEGD